LSCRKRWELTNCQTSRESRWWFWRGFRKRSQWLPPSVAPGNGDAIRKFDVAYFTASCDDAETNKKFAESLNLDYPILSDPKQETALAYGVVNAQRKVPFRWTYYIGKDGRILYIDDKVQTESHGADVAAKLKERPLKK
jgi:peroxiredoxin Q/BCP